MANTKAENLRPDRGLRPSQQDGQDESIESSGEGSSNLAGEEMEAQLGRTPNGPITIPAEELLEDIFGDEAP